MNCLYCQKYFLIQPYLKRKDNYCSRECYWINTKRKQQRNCQVCGKSFQIKAYLVKEGYGLYCSKECWFGLFNKWKKEVKCKQCKKVFLVTRAVLRQKPKFCSKACSDESKRDFVIRICKQCANNFELPRSDLNRGRGTFCTWECYKKYRGESSLELLVRKQLEKINEPFQQEMRVGKFRADFYLPKRNLVIECDGEFWHMTEEIKLRDQRKDRFLAKLGYNILRLRGQDIVNSGFALKEFIDNI